MAIEVEDVLVSNVPDSVKEDIIIENGDFKIYKSDQQHIQHILKANPGQFYQHPLVGLAVANYSGASLNPQALKQAIKTQLKADNYKPKVVEVTEDFTVNIDAERLK